jgi:hypothetical protein
MTRAALTGPDGRVAITDAFGRCITGVVMGCGGVIALAAVERAIRRATDFKPTGIYEPFQGHCAVYPDYSAQSDGPRVVVDLIGARAEAACDRERRAPQLTLFSETP